MGDVRESFDRGGGLADHAEGSHCDPPLQAATGVHSQCIGLQPGGEARYAGPASVGSAISLGPFRVAEDEVGHLDGHQIVAHRGEQVRTDPGPPIGHEGHLHRSSVSARRHPCPEIGSLHGVLAVRLPVRAQLRSGRDAHAPSNVRGTDAVTAVEAPSARILGAMRPFGQLLHGRPPYGLALSPGAQEAARSPRCDSVT